MALTFNGTSSKLTGANLVTGYPFSIFCWFRPGAAALTNTLSIVGAGDLGGNTEAAMWAGGAVAGDPARAFVSDTASSVTSANSDVSMVQDQWQPCLVVFRSDTSRSVFLGNGTMVTDATSKVLTFANFDRFVIGCRPRSDTLWFSGDIADVALWDLSLERDDWASLKAGAPPDQIQSQKLVDYWSLDTQAATQTGVKGNVLTASNTSQAGTAPPAETLIPSTTPLRDGGGWCWFSEPRAVQYNGNTYVGWTAPSGSVGISKISHTTWRRDYFTLAANFEQDDHDNPTVWIRPDGRIMVFWSKHADTTGVRYKLSTNAEDITSWGSEQVIPTPVPGNWMSYNNPRYLSGNSTLYQHFRALKTGSDRPHWVVSSTDNGATWGTPVETFKQAGERPYVKSITNGTDRIDFFMAQGNPGEGGLITNVYHCIGKLDAGVLKYYKSNGTTELTLPISVNADLDKVYNSASYGNISGWEWDCKYDSNGYPRILFERTLSASDGRCCIVKWNGSAWAAHVEVTPMGARISTDASSEYTAGMCFGATVNEVYVGIEDSGHSNITKWSSSDDGATWSKTEDVTSTTTSGYKNARPYMPQNATGVRLLWWGGTYNSYTDYDTDIFYQAGSISGSIAVTESGGDTASLAGDVFVIGALAAAETGSDTAALTGTGLTVTSGTLAATESGSDTAALTGDVFIIGSLAAADTGADTAAATGAVIVSGSLAATESGADSAAFSSSGMSAITGALAATESGADTAGATGTVLVRGSAAITEAGADTAIVVGKVFVSGLLSATEAGADAASISGTAAGAITGSMAATESGADVALFMSRLLQFSSDRMLTVGAESRVLVLAGENTVLNA